MANATTLLYGEGNVLSDRHIDYYAERAKGGVALQVSEQHAVSTVTTGAFAACVSAAHPAAVSRFAELAEAVHEYDSRFFVQLFAPGAADSGTFGVEGWRPVWSVSRMPSYQHDEIPAVMGKDEISALVAGHARSARNVAAGGLDGVEIHAAHGWLVGLFLSPFWNDRRDAYGGSVRNRCRLALEIAEAIRDAAPELALGIQLSLDEHLDGLGITPDETEEQLAIMSESGLFDYFDISTGALYSTHQTIPPMVVPEAFLADFGRRARQIVGDRAKIFLVGRVRDIATAARLVEDGCADMVAMARALIADPFLVRKAREGRESETTRCIGENECVLRTSLERPTTCVVNPISGREAAWGSGRDSSPPPVPRKVLVVGGGPAGLRVAAAAAARGHAVTLTEREDEVGGHLRLLARMPTRSPWQEAIDDLERAAARTGVRVLLGVDVDADLALRESSDMIIVATGADWDTTAFSPARPAVPSIPGVEASHVLDIADAAWRALADPRSLGLRVLLVDESGEYLPIGLADLLSSTGTEVEVVSRHDRVGSYLYGTLEAPFVLPRLVAAGVRLTPRHYVEAIDHFGVDLVDEWGTRRRAEPIDTVVLSMLRTPRDRLFADLRREHVDVRVVGDALAPRRTAEVIYEGESVGRSL